MTQIADVLSVQQMRSSRIKILRWRILKTLVITSTYLLAVKFSMMVGLDIGQAIIVATAIHVTIYSWRESR